MPLIVNKGYKFKISLFLFKIKGCSKFTFKFFGRLTVSLINPSLMKFKSEFGLI